MAKNKVLKKIIPAKHPILLAGCKLVILMHLCIYVIFVLVKAVSPSSNIIDRIIDCIFHAVLLINIVHFVLLYIVRCTTVYYLTTRELIAVQRIGPYKKKYKLRYSEINEKVKYYPYNETIGAIYINMKTHGAFWDNLKLHSVSNTPNKSIILCYVEDGVNLCKLINQLRYETTH